MSNALTILPPPQLPATTDQPTVVNELVMDDGSAFGHFNLAYIRISYTNRKRFNLPALTELAESIKAIGVAQPILIRPVTPTPEAPQRYEVVAGERRYRAAIMAGCVSIPAMCRTLTDLEAAKLQILENLQREDPHPMEEAEGFERLMLTHGYTADQLAQDLKHSRTYVYNRLKLCRLALDLREQFMDGKFEAATAELLARLPSPEMQKKAAKDILKPDYQGETMSVRAVKEHLRQHYTVELKGCVFSIKDASLLPSAGACTTCPKRSGNQADSDEKTGNVCMDPACFREKELAYSTTARQQAENRGQTVLTGEAAKKIKPYPSSDLRSGYSDLDSMMYVGGQQTSYRKLLGKGIAGTVLLEDPYKPGKLIEIARTNELEALMAEVAGAGKTPAAQEALRKSKEKKQEQQAAIERQYRRNLFVAVHEAGAPAGEPWNEREVAILLVRNSPSSEDGFIRKLYGWTGAEFEGRHVDRRYVSTMNAICAHIRSMETEQVRQIIRDMTLVRDLAVNTYTGSTDMPERLLAAAAAHGIDAAAIKDTLVQAAKAKEKAKEKKANPKAAKAKAPAQGDLLPATAAKPVKTKAPVAKKGEWHTTSVSSLDTEEALRDLMVARPECLPEVAAVIIAHYPDRVGILEAAATAAGYSYSGAGWNKIETPQTGDSEQPAIPAGAELTDAPAAQTQRPKLQLKSKPTIAAAPADGPVIKVKKNRSAELAPAAAWPFPTGSTPDNQTA